MKRFIIAIILNIAAAVVAAMIYAAFRSMDNQYPAVQWAILSLHVVPKLHIGTPLVIAGILFFLWGQWAIRKSRRSIRVLTWLVYFLTAAPGYWIIHVYVIALPDIKMLDTMFQEYMNRELSGQPPEKKLPALKQPPQPPPPATRMSSMQALGVANEAAISNGYALYMYSPADISYNSTAEQWSVTRKGRYTGTKGTKGKSIVVLIHDKTGETTVSEILNNDGQSGSGYPPQGVGSPDP